MRSTIGRSGSAAAGLRSPGIDHIVIPSSSVTVHCDSMAARPRFAWARVRLAHTARSLAVTGARVRTNRRASSANASSSE